MEGGGLRMRSGVVNSLPTLVAFFVAAKAKKRQKADKRLFDTKYVSIAYYLTVKLQKS